MTLSKERLQELAVEEDMYNFAPEHEELNAMARELLERRERDTQEPAPQLKNLEHFIAFWRKVQGGHILPSKNDMNHTVWFMEGLADIAAPPAPVVPDEMYWQDAPVEGSTRAAAYATGWNACRAAMLKQQSSIQDRDDAASGAEIKQPASNCQAIPDCWCRTCRPVTVADMRFVVCPDCGNKRCPKANDHRNSCSGSNEPGQDGSAYPAAPKQESE